jgi:hypothetical protein
MTKSSRGRKVFKELDALQLCYGELHTQDGGIE